MKKYRITKYYEIVGTISEYKQTHTFQAENEEEAKKMADEFDWMSEKITFTDYDIYNTLDEQEAIEEVEKE